MLHEKTKVRIIETHCANSAENMATDEALLKNFVYNDSTIFRLYTWESDSLTIGASQKLSDYKLAHKYNDTYAKRITGGGILYHGHDLSYSLIIPTEILKEYTIKQSYEKICSFILTFYRKLGLKTCFAKDNDQIELSKSAYCQVGYEAYDILVDGQKIGGNAQRRTKKAIFQHGSIPIYSTSINGIINPQTGISLEDIGIKIDYQKASELLIESFKESFNVECENSSLSPQEFKTKEELLKDKYDYASDKL